MATLQQALAANGDPPSTPPPLTPDTAPPTVGAAVLPAANATPPISTGAAIEQLARERFGGNFVDTYGDLLGTRPTGPGDYLRNATNIFTSGNTGLPMEQAFQGAQARSQLVSDAHNQARAQRMDLMKLYSFVAGAHKAKMQPAAIKALFAEQYKAISGQDPSPAVTSALTQEDSPLAPEVLSRLNSGTWTAKDAIDLGADPSKAIELLNNRENTRARQAQVANEEARTAGIAHARDVRDTSREKATREHHVGRIQKRLDDIAKTILSNAAATGTPMTPAEAYAQAHAMIGGLPAPAPSGLSQGAAPRPLIPGKDFTVTREPPATP